MDESDEDSGSDKQQQQSDASETDADVGPWQPKVLAASDAEGTQPAAAASSVSLPAHTQVSLQCCSGSMSSPSAGVWLCSQRIAHGRKQVKMCCC